MAWEWSHTPEAYENARNHLYEQDHGWLVVCLAEIDASMSHPDYCGDHAFNNDKYKRRLPQLISLTKDVLANAIWRFAEEYRTCDNGGFNAHVCPYGCHTVSFDD